jgi:hypothetical protein
MKFLTTREVAPLFAAGLLSISATGCNTIKLPQKQKSLHNCRVCQ